MERINRMENIEPRDIPQKSNRPGGSRRKSFSNQSGVDAGFDPNAEAYKDTGIPKVAQLAQDVLRNIGNPDATVQPTDNPKPSGFFHMFKKLSQPLVDKITGKVTE